MIWGLNLWMSGGHFMLNDYFKATFIAGALTVCILGIVLKLFYLQVVKHDFYEDMAKNQSSVTVTLDKNRGMIFDRNAKVLATNVYTASVYVDASKIKNPKNFIYVLSVNGVNLSNRVKEKILKKDRFVWIDRGLDVESARKLTRLDENLQLIYQERRFYPEGDTASKIVGFTGIDNQGLEGVETFFEKTLKGEKVNVAVLRDSRGNTMTFEDKIMKTSPDKNIYLSLDVDLQKVVSGILYNDLKEFGAKGVLAGAMDIQTGEIIFSTSLPSFDANSFENYKRQLWKDPLFYYLFEPGSIFKAVTFAALSDAGVLKWNEKVNCENGKYYYMGHTFNDVHEYKELNLSEVFAFSSNIGTIKLSEKITSRQFYDYIKKYGFGDSSGVVGFADETGLLRNYKQWSGLSRPSISIGQEVLVTPIQILRFYASIANGGYLITPRVIKGVSKERKKIMSDYTANLLKELLIKVVEDGTGQNAKSSIVKIAGKTGTAQKFDKESNSYSYREYNSSFVGFFPAENPKFVMIVTYDSPKKSIYGGSTAAYTFRKLAEQIAVFYKLNLNQMLVEDENKRAS